MPRGQARLCLLEYDQRFSVFQEEYKHYDYQQPLRLGAEMKGAFDRVFCDPPFLSEDCQTKAAITVRWLCKGYSESTMDLSDLHQGVLRPRIIVCTGERMEEIVRRLHPDIFTTDFEPRHAQGRLDHYTMLSNCQVPKAEMQALK
ncbi:MAG: Protein-lysine N-methyltransferase efm5 [Ramalina farinacea]|uniref:Protein-lysine N-methyltransferase efm5 n=1 Tax=Ramalina farinacea TaxID=258253 RepID=A0AA43QED4_9LECA|nr:Protein-lysine N-methyltransferase efm5 [Ramalina farinacea]